MILCEKITFIQERSCLLIVEFLLIDIKSKYAVFDEVNHKKTVDFFELQTIQKSLLILQYR